jgi:dephospho-CoA kinase
MYHDTHKDEHEIVIVDGVRRMSDIEYLSQVPYFKLVYIDSDVQTRYERVTKRGENPDDAKKTFEEFNRDNEDESESQIRELKNYANYVVDNNGTFADLYKQIENIIKENLQ